MPANLPAPSDAWARIPWSAATSAPRGPIRRPGTMQLHHHHTTAASQGPDPLEHGVRAGLVAGAVMLAALTAVLWIMGAGPWAATRLLASVVGVPFDTTASLVAVAIGLGVHAVCSMAFGIGFCMLVAGPLARGRDHQVELGALAYGLLLWVVNVGILGSLLPMGTLPGMGLWLVLGAAHLLYAAVLAARLLAARDAPLYAFG